MHEESELYRHRHRWPYWDDTGTDKVIPLVAQAAIDWQVMHYEHAQAPTGYTRDRLRRAMLNLGVAAWWALNQYSDELYQPEQLDLAGRAEDFDERENWPAAEDPLDAWRAVIATRLSVLFGMTATGFGDPDEAAVMYRRQLLFVASQSERALKLL